MSRTASDYQGWLGRHLPPGLDWLRIDPRVMRLLAGLGRVFVRADIAADLFAADAIPDQSTGDRLAAWETTCATPDLDYPTTTTVAERQAAVARVLSQGGIPTPALYIALAAVWSVVVTVWEPAGWPYHFWVEGPPAHVTLARYGTAHFGDMFATRSVTWGHIMRLVGRYKPAHIKAHDTDIGG